MEYNFKYTLILNYFSLYYIIKKSKKSNLNKNKNIKAFYLFKIHKIK